MLEGDGQYFEKHGQLEMVTVSENLIGGRLDYPRQVSKVCVVTIDPV